VVRCGKLIFINLDDKGPSLESFLGPVTHARIQEFFSDDFTQIDGWEGDHAANWKIPIENSLETYHVPTLHRRTFKVMPEKDRASHTLAAQYTSYEQAFSPSPSMQRLGRFLRKNPRYSYIHHHAFPHLTISNSTLVSYMQVVYPTSVTTSRSLVRLFLAMGDQGQRRQRILATMLLSRRIRRFVRAVFAEDGSVFPDVQRGLQTSQSPGLISTREERIYAFQRFVAGRTFDPVDHR
jgi:choline monooxygenase